MGFFSRMFGRSMNMEDVTPQSSTCSQDTAQEGGSECQPQIIEPSPFLAEESQDTKDQD